MIKQKEMNLASALQIYQRLFCQLIFPLRKLAEKMDKKFVSKYISEHVKSDLQWYKRDGLMTYIDQLKYQEFIKNSDDHLQKVQIINFDIISHVSRGYPLETP